MKRNWVRLAALAAALSCLGGCAFSSPEELYAVPRAAEDYKNLQDQIDRVRSAGAEMCIRDSCITVVWNLSTCTRGIPLWNIMLLFPLRRKPMA